MDFFTEKELNLQIGDVREGWPLAVIKELIDNALDACESANTLPEIAVTVEPDALTITDNGPGLPTKTIRGSIDYMVRISDKRYYVGPTRGQLGNALKCVWAAPFVWQGNDARIVIDTAVARHTINVALDKITRTPHVTLTLDDPIVQSGTSMRIEWSQVSSYIGNSGTLDLYNEAFLLLRGYTLCNPHATFHVRSENECATFARSVEVCEKWGTSEPTVAHWYTVPTLRNLIAAHIDAASRGCYGLGDAVDCVHGEQPQTLPH